MLDNGPHLSSRGMFCPKGRFFPLDVLSLGTFCPLGPDVWRPYVHGTFCPMGHLSVGLFVPLDVFFRETFCLRTFLSLDFLSVHLLGFTDTVLTITTININSWSFNLLFEVFIKYISQRVEGKCRRSFQLLDGVYRRASLQLTFYFNISYYSRRAHIGIRLPLCEQSPNPWCHL